MNRTGSIGLGAALVLAAVSLLYWNEGRAVRTVRALDEGSRAVEATQIDEVASRADGTLVHAVGPLTAPTPITDPYLGIGFPGLKLSRSVETYQYRVRTETLDGGDRVETVTLEWTTEPTTSPTGEAPSLPLPVGDATSYAAEVRFGGLLVTRPLLDRYREAVGVILTATDQEAIRLHLGLWRVEVDEGYLYLPFGFGTAGQPRLGDYRLTLEVVPAGTVSLVGRTSGGLLELYTARSGTAIGIIEAGAHSAAAMVETASRENDALTTALRLAGAGMSFGGVRLVLGRLLGFLGFIPVFGSAFRLGLGAVAGALGLSTAVSVVAVAWLAHRPVVALVALALALAVGWYVVVAGRTAGASAASASTASASAANASTANASEVGRVV